MFEKLLSVLPYNPSLVQQLSFYGKRMRREAAVRRTGVVFLLLAFFVQFFAFLSPPQPTVANSTNDIVNGGFTSVADAVSKCRNNVQNYRQILDHYGISCDDLARSTKVSIRSTDSNKQLYSMGRNSQGQTNTRTGKPTGEVPVNVTGVGTFYFRYLWSFDSGAYSTYTALKGTSSLGKTFYILYNCANPVFAGVPAPKPAPAPAPAPKPTPAPAPTPAPVDKVTLETICRTSYKGFLVKALLTSGNKYVYHVNGVEVASVVATTTGWVDRSFTFSSTNIELNKQATVKVINATNGITIGTETVTNNCSTPVPVVVPTPTPEPTPIPCAYNPNLPATSPDCKPCDKSVSSTDSLACIFLKKAASNETQNIADANNTTAQAGDVILYTLTAENKGKATIKDYIFQDNMSDVLDYADITNLYGGTKTAENAVIWPAVDIAPGKSVSVKLGVTVKAEIPTTPQVAGTGHYDHVMTNVYANAININLPQATVVQIQTAATTLPQTGPAETLAATAVVVVLAAYFYSRSRLLAYETNVVIRDNNSGGF